MNSNLNLGKNSIYTFNEETQKYEIKLNKVEKYFNEQAEIIKKLKYHKLY